MVTLSPAFGGEGCFKPIKHISLRDRRSTPLRPSASGAQRHGAIGAHSGLSFAQHDKNLIIQKSHYMYPLWNKALNLIYFIQILPLKCKS